MQYYERYENYICAFNPFVPNEPFLVHDLAPEVTNDLTSLTT